MRAFEEFYFFMHMHDEGLSPELTQCVVTEFQQEMQELNLQEVKFIK